MPELQTSSASADAALLRAANELADSSLKTLFDRPSQNGAVDLDAQLTSGRFSPFIEDLKSPLQGLERREGLLIQSAVTLALQARKDLIVFPTVRIPVTDADRKVVSANRHADLRTLGAPEAGDEVGRVEIDVAVVNPAQGLLQLVDIKRVPRTEDRDRTGLMEGALALKRRLKREGLNFAATEIVLLRWFPGHSVTITGGLDTCKTIDDTLGAPIRNVVDVALDRFREGVDKRIRAHVSRCLNMETQKQSAENQTPNHEPTPILADLEVLRRAFEGDRCVAGKKAW